MPADTHPASPARIAAALGYPDASLYLVAQSGSADLWRLTPQGHDAPAPVVLKCPRGLSTKIRAEADALAFLNAAHMPNVPTLLHTDRDAGGLALSWLHPACVTLDTWLATQPADADIARVASQLGAWCARLHSLDVPPGPVKLSADPLPWPERLITQARDAVHSLRKRARRNPALQPQLARCERELHTLTADIHAADLPARPGMMMHRDLRPPNILVAHDLQGAAQLCGVVDFERAGAGDPAWDVAKLDWWCFEPYPSLQKPFWNSYQATLPRPSNARVTLYKRFEALGLLATFAGKHPSYPDEATQRLDQLASPASSHSDVVIV
jgi:aminoglycoside/choline kinase family phosphotransferase